MSMFDDNDHIYHLDVDYSKGYSIAGEQYLVFFKSHKEFIEYIREHLSADMADCITSTDFTVDLADGYDLVHRIGEYLVWDDTREKSPALTVRSLREAKEKLEEVQKFLKDFYDILGGDY